MLHFQVSCRSLLFPFTPNLIIVTYLRKTRLPCLKHNVAFRSSPVFVSGGQFQRIGEGPPLSRGYGDGEHFHKPHRPRATNNSFYRFPSATVVPGFFGRLDAPHHWRSPHSLVSRDVLYSLSNYTGKRVLLWNKSCPACGFARGFLTAQLYMKHGSRPQTPNWGLCFRFRHSACFLSPCGIVWNSQGLACVLRHIDNRYSEEFKSLVSALSSRLYYSYHISFSRAAHID